MSSTSKVVAIVSVAVAGALAVLFTGLFTLGILSAIPLFEQRTASLSGPRDIVPDGWEVRLARDYPAWKVVGFVSFPASDAIGERRTQYLAQVIPPERRFSIGVIYEAPRDGAVPVSDDEVLRAGGARHSEAASLLDFIEDQYVARGKAVEFITSDSDATAVSWKPAGGGRRMREGTIDMLECDSETGTWEVVP